MALKPYHRSILAAALAAVLALAAAPGLAAACVIDNTASLFVGGVQASRNLSTPTGSGPWAPFTIDKVFASGSALQFNENRRDLARSLSAATLSAPYRWVFGDGSATLGHTVAHRYAHPGLYALAVYGYVQRTHTWFPFDKALVRIVPPGQTLLANLGYYALQALDVAVSGLMWLIDAALVALVLYLVLHRRKRPVDTATTLQAELPGDGGAIHDGA